MTIGTDRRDRFRNLAYRIRSIPGQGYGLRPHTVTVLTGSWSGDHTGDGSESIAEVEITEANGQPPKVRWLKEDQIVVGNLAKGSVEIGPITPNFPGGGTLLTDLDGEDLTTGETFHVRITGPQHPSGAVYRVTRIDADRALQYKLTAMPVANSE